MFQLLVGLLFSLSAVGQPAFLKDGLIAYYPFNGNANDESGNALNGNGSFFSYVSDRFNAKNSAVEFLSKGYIDIPSEVVYKFNYTKQITTALWIQANPGPTVNDPIFCLGQQSIDRAFNLYTYFDKISYSQWGVNNNLLTAQSVKNGKWLHVVIVGNFNLVTIYFNGERVGDRSVNIQFPLSSGATLGAQIDHAISWSGSLDDVRIYNRAFSDAEVKALYDYESVPQPSNPRIATATAQVVNGFVIGATVTDGGYGYTNNPSVTITGGGGSGAKATATQVDGVVTGITITNPGSGYTSVPTITIASPPFPPRKATATSEVVNGFVVGATVTDGGFGYDAAPAILLSGGGGSGATATAIVQNGVVTGITITNPGSGYTTAPKVLIASPPFTPELAIEVSKVSVKLKVVLGRKYQLEASNDLSTWTETGAAFVAEAEELVQEFDVNQVGRYFRINQVP